MGNIIQESHDLRFITGTTVKFHQRSVFCGHFSPENRYICASRQRSGKIVSETPHPEKRPNALTPPAARGGSVALPSTDEVFLVPSVFQERIRLLSTDTATVYQSSRDAQLTVLNFNITQATSESAPLDFDYN